ncbi:hypothetical protein POTOM_050794 [Populus tomentosa]|uniref:Pentatricopeptide repeat-containing protein n=1 Tax=Populus tomentosa TaxID=118781 RepID=A0A8X7Y4U5_POPTO|nr:hypothetical protein POTOM_050794 [Populus tomentosa]
MVDLKIRPDNFALISTLSACAQLGELEKGKKVHDFIERNAIKVDSFLSTGLVDLYAKWVKPDGIGISGVLVGSSHEGLGDEARKLFDEMESVNKVPREPKHYGCMADLPGRAGLIKEVTEIIKDIPKGGDMSVWSGLLGGRRIHGDVEIVLEY